MPVGWVRWSSVSPAEFAGWSMFDPAIAGWLLDSEHPARSFADLLTAHGMTLDAGVSERMGLGWGGGMAVTATTLGECCLLANVSTVGIAPSCMPHPTLTPAEWQCTGPCVQGPAAAGTSRTDPVQEDAGVPATPHSSPSVVVTLHHLFSIPPPLSLSLPLPFSLSPPPSPPPFVSPKETWPVGALLVCGDATCAADSR